MAARNLTYISALFLRIGTQLYEICRLSCDPGIAVRAFRLSKGDGTRYDVLQTHFGAECDCPDFLFRRDGIDPAGCKHVKALRAQGLVARVEAASLFGTSSKV